jgi:hypothetical protein
MRLPGSCCICPGGSCGALIIGDDASRGWEGVRRQSPQTAATNLSQISVPVPRNPSSRIPDPESLIQNPCVGLPLRQAAPAAGLGLARVTCAQRSPRPEQLCTADAGCVGPSERSADTPPFAKKHQGERDGLTTQPAGCRPEGWSPHDAPPTHEDASATLRSSVGGSRRTGPGPTTMPAVVGMRAERATS